MTCNCESETNSRSTPAERRLIAQNFFWLSASQVAARFVALFSNVYARRTLGPVLIGQYNWCQAVVSYFSLVSNPGLETIAKRDVAREPLEGGRRLSQMITIQFTLALATLVLAAVFAISGLRGPAVGRLLIVLSLALAIIPFNISWYLQAHERMAPAAIGMIVIQLIKFPLLLLFVREPAHLMRYAVLDYPLQGGLVVFLFWYAVRHRLLSWSEVRPSLRNGTRLLKEALPVGLSQAAILLYYNFDVILLGVWNGDRTVGIYSTAYGLMLVPTMLSGSLSSAYFPRLSRVRGNAEESERVSTEFLKILLWIGTPIAAFGWAFGRFAVVLLYGHSFAAAGPLLEWLCLDIALIFFNVGVGNPFDAWGLQSSHFKVGCAGAGLNVALNLVLIPRFGAWGAVATTLLAEVVVGVGCLWVRARNVPVRWIYLSAKPFVLCAPAAAIGKYLAQTFPEHWSYFLVLLFATLVCAIWRLERHSLRGFLAGKRKECGLVAIV